MKKNFYSVYGLNICSKMDNTDKIANTSTEKEISYDVTIRFGKVNLPNDLVNENFKATKDCIYIFEKDKAKVKIYKGQEIIIEPANSVDKKNFLPHNLGIPLALLLHQRGLLVLHGSAIETNDGVVGFLGHSGEGKSTTTFALYEKGFNFFTDEFIVIKLNNSGVPTVFPGFPMLKLSKDLISYFKKDLNLFNLISEPHSDKYIYKLDQKFNNSSLPLKEIYIIKKGKKTSINELNQHDAFMSLIEHNYCIGMNNYYDADIFSTSAKLMKNIEIKTLEIYPSFEKLTEIVKIIQNEIN